MGQVDDGDPRLDSSDLPVDGWLGNEEGAGLASGPLVRFGSPGGDQNSYFTRARIMRPMLGTPGKGR